jgi:SAM-dependent methyltransferase
MTPAEAYAAQIDAVNAQQARLQAGSGEGGLWERMARQFRMDPRRAPDRNLGAIAGLIEPADVVVDVGGGAGRVCLPLALHCREVINVEPSPGMGEQFRESAAEAGIANARVVKAEWMAEHGAAGDVTVVCNVTYFVREIVPFVGKLVAASRCRVIISVWSVPPPASNEALYAAVMGEAQVRPPSHRELLPVLWDMGILPDVQVLPETRVPGRPQPTQTRTEAIESCLGLLRPKDAAAARARFEANFDQLFRKDDQGFVPAWRAEAREMLITWETNGR